MAVTTDETSPMGSLSGPTMFSSEDSPPSMPADFLPSLPGTDPASLTQPQLNGTHTGLPQIHVDAQERTPNPRSCVTCRKRKVKCDKTHPCSNCNRAHVECVFPSQGRAPRRVRKFGEGRDKGLLERLRRLEGVVKGLGVDVPGGSIDGDKSKDTSPSNEVRARAGSAETVDGADTAPDATTSGGEPKQQRANGRSTEASKNGDKEFQEKTRLIEDDKQGRFENRCGRLVVNEGRSRYICNPYWANLSTEVEDLKGILHDDSDDSEEESSPGSQPHILGNHQGWIFGLRSQNVDLLPLHPLPSQLETYWIVYKENVDPLCKVLHIPSIEPTVLSAAAHLSNLSKSFEALLFAIYYAATTSLVNADCLSKLGEEKSVLLAQYRFAIEQALAKANFLTTEEITVLQAFVTFLICLRRNSDDRVIWTLTGLIVRIAQTIGIHRDGLHFGLAPFEIEMRRRMWWQVYILDSRASEDQGCDPTIIEHSFDTKMPLNINDVDLTPDMKELPPERKGCTDMSFCLIRFEGANTYRRINYVAPAPPQHGEKSLTSVTLADKERWITECYQRLEERYLKHCDMTVPLYWVTATVARLIMSKIWLMVYHPFQRKDGGANLPAEMKDKLFITSLENIEYSILLETEARTMRWGWLFKTYMQWHAMAFILSELCHRTTGDMVERAWKAVEHTRDGRWKLAEDTKTGHLWKPLKMLHRKAKHAHARGLAEEQAARSGPPSRTYTPNANPMFGHPNKPRPVRAPLSQAQLTRFSEGPVSGYQPLDSQELLKSPRLTDGAMTDDPMDMTEIPTEMLLQPMQQEINQGMRPTGTRTTNLRDPTGVNFLSPQPRESQAALQNSMYPTTQRSPQLRSAPIFGYSFNSTFQSDLDSTAPPNGSDGMVSATNGAANDPMRMDSFDSNADFGDLGNLDTGELNWENWDQLVRQFGMDVDQTPGSSGQAADWAGADWDVGRNMGVSRGFGIGGDPF